MVDDVTSPEHYTGDIEPIDYMRSLFTQEEMRGALRANVLKYVSRYTKKGGVEDLRKAHVYLGWLIDHEIKHGVM